MPAPWRSACRRTNQLPIPASGASSTRLRTRKGPSEKASVSSGAGGMPNDVRRLGAGVELAEKPQAGEGEEVVDLVDLLGEGHDEAAEAAGGDDGEAFPKLVVETPQDRVDGAGLPEDNAAADGVDGVLADDGARRGELDLGQARAALGERVERNFNTGHERPADVL